MVSVTRKLRMRNQLKVAVPTAKDDAKYPILMIPENVQSKRVSHLDWLELLPVSHITALLECKHCGLVRVCGLSRRPWYTERRSIELSHTK